MSVGGSQCAGSSQPAQRPLTQVRRRGQGEGGPEASLSRVGLSQGRSSSSSCEAARLHGPASRSTGPCEAAWSTGPCEAASHGPRARVRQLAQPLASAYHRAASEAMRRKRRPLPSVYSCAAAGLGVPQVLGWRGANRRRPAALRVCPPPRRWGGGGGADRRAGEGGDGQGDDDGVDHVVAAAEEGRQPAGGAAALPHTRRTRLVNRGYCSPARRLPSPQPGTPPAVAAVADDDASGSRVVVHDQRAPSRRAS